MGKKVFKTILKVAAVAAISYFAPVVGAKLATTIGVKGALASTVASAAVGAAAGEATGIGWKQGLMAGGFAGAGQSGLFGGAPASGAAGAATTAPAQGAAGTAGTAGTAATGVGGATAAGVQGAGVMGATGLKMAGITPGVTAAAAPQTLGSALSAAASNPLQAVGTGLRNLTGGVGAGLNALGSAVGLAPGAVGAVAPQLLASQLAGNPGAALARAQEAELQRAQQYNAALTQQRLDEAKKLIGEAEYFDPEYMGRQAAEAAMIRGGIQEVEGTRGLTGERRAAEQRRYRLGTARTAGTAYQQGFGTGADMRTQTRAAGISAMPTQYPTTSPEAALLAQETASRRQRGRTRSLNVLLDQVLGRPGGPSAGLVPSVDTAMDANADIF